MYISICHVLTYVYTYTYIYIYTWLLCIFIYCISVYTYIILYALFIFVHFFIYQCSQDSTGLLRSSFDPVHRALIHQVLERALKRSRRSGYQQLDRDSDGKKPLNPMIISLCQKLIVIIILSLGIPLTLNIKIYIYIHTYILTFFYTYICM